MPLCTFVPLRLLSELFVSQDDEIKAVYGSFFGSYNSCDGSLWAAAFRCCSRFACESRWCPRCKAEGQVAPLDLMLAPLPWLIHTICGLSEHINLLGNSFRAQSSPPFASDTLLFGSTFVLCWIKVLFHGTCDVETPTPWESKSKSVRWITRVWGERNSRAFKNKHSVLWREDVLLFIYYYLLLLT